MDTKNEILFKSLNRMFFSSVKLVLSHYIITKVRAYENLYAGDKLEKQRPQDVVKY